MRVLAQPTSASSCERNWSTYDFVHSKRRNRLCHARADKLVYVFSNLRLLTHATAGSYEEAQVGWQYVDADAEGANSEDSDSQADPTCSEEDDAMVAQAEAWDREADEFVFEQAWAGDGEAVAATGEDAQQALGVAGESNGGDEEGLMDQGVVLPGAAAAPGSEAGMIGGEPVRRSIRERRFVIRD